MSFSAAVQITGQQMEVDRTSRPGVLDLAQLAVCSKHEIVQFRRGQQRDSCHCYELWRRTFYQRTPEAWEYFYDVYQGQVASWVRRHPNFHATGEPLDHFVAAAFARLWRSMKPETFCSCRDLAALLSYFVSCVHGEITDTIRRLPPRHAKLYLADMEPADKGEDWLERLPANGESPEAYAVYMEYRLEFWANIQSLLNTDKERLVMEASFIRGLHKAEQIYELYKSLFADVQEVYRVKANLLRRLRRNKDTVDWQKFLE